MDEKKQRSKQIDDFWDIASLVPKKPKPIAQTRSTDTVEISLSTTSTEENQTVIKRMIPAHGEAYQFSKNTDLIDVESYSPNDLLIHRVSIKKWKTQYNYYSGFLKDAIKYNLYSGHSCEYVPFYSYVPQYDQMNSQQLSYYLWFRENAREKNYIKTDSGYLFLYIYELLNLGDRLNVEESQTILTDLWNKYHDEFPAISSKLADWICDFSLLHKLPSPKNADSRIVQKVFSLKEFYINIPTDDMLGCAKALMKYCSSYDFHTSKFSQGENLKFFETHIPLALVETVKYYSADGKILSGLDFGDSTITRDVYAGALCTAEQKYRIEVSYCSFSRSNELRFYIGDVIKYSENKLRSFLGIKSKMTVYSISVELRDILDRYFETNLPRKNTLKQRTEPKHEYDVLYDIPRKKLSLTDAAKIESESWEMTNQLITAFDDEITEITSDESPVNSVFDAFDSSDLKNSTDECDINTALGDYLTAVKEMAKGNLSVFSELSKRVGKMPDSLLDEINEISFNTIGDAILEDDGMGKYQVIDDYKDLFLE